MRSSSCCSDDGGSEKGPGLKELKFVSFFDDIKFCGGYLVNRKSLLNLKFVKFAFLVMNIKK